MKNSGLITILLLVSLPLHASEHGALAFDGINGQRDDQKQNLPIRIKNERSFLLSKAFSFYYEGDINKAIQKFKKYIKTYKEHSIPLRYLGLIYFQLGQVREAVKYMEKAAKAGEEDIATHELLGKLYLNLNRFEDAEQTYLKILELEPLNENSLEILANLYERKRDRRKSISFFKRLFIAARKNSNSETLYRSLQKLGAYYYNAHKFEKAIRCYEHLRDLDPTNPKISHILGDLYKINGNLERAKVEYEKMLRVNPKSIKVYLSLIEVYYLTGSNKFRAAVENFTSKYKKASPLINAFFSELHQQPNETEYLFRLVLAKEPKSLSARIGLVKVYQKLKDYENLKKETFSVIYIAQKMKLLKIAQKYEIFMLNLVDQENKDVNFGKILALKKPSKNLMNDRIEELIKVYIDLYSAHAHTMEALNLNKNALSYYYKILSLVNGLIKYVTLNKGANTSSLKSLQYKKYQTLLQIGWLLHSEPYGKYQEALKALRKAGDVDPKISRHHFLIGVIRYHMGKDKKFYYKLASRSLKRAIKLEKASQTPSNYFFYLGISLDKQDRFKEAEEMLKKAIELEPTNSMYLNYLGYIYLVRETNYDEASKLLLKALEDEPENEAYLDSLGWLFYKTGNYTKALVQLLIAADQAQKNNNIDSVIYFHLAETYLKLKKWNLAHHYFKKTLARIEDASEELNIKYIHQQIGDLKKK